MDFPSLMENPDKIRVGFSVVDGKSRRDSCWIFLRWKIQTRFVLDFPSVFELGSGVVTDVLAHVLTCDVLVRAASFPACCCVYSWNGAHVMLMIVCQQPAASMWLTHMSVCVWVWWQLVILILTHKRLHSNPSVFAFHVVAMFLAILHAEYYYYYCVGGGDLSCQQ